MKTNANINDKLYRLGLPKAVVLDMDGTFFLGDQLLPGALELLNYLNAKDIPPFSFLTNNTSKGKADYVHKLMGFGGVKRADARILPPVTRRSVT